MRENAIRQIMTELHLSGMSFEEVMNGLHDMKLKNQNAIRTILTAIGRYYTKRG